MSKKLTTAEFIESVIKTHGSTYDYSLVNYKNDRTPVDIICSLHGVFSQNPGGHKRGNRCPKCVSTIAGTTKTKLAADTFLARCIEVHGTKYSYEFSYYINSTTHLVIVCKEHGDFLQIPNSHLNGSGCPHCAKEASSMLYRSTIPSGKSTELYYVYLPESNLWKIGCTSRGIALRFRSDKVIVEVIQAKTYEDSRIAYFVESWILKATLSNKTHLKPLKGGNSELRSAPITDFLILVMEAESNLPNFSIS